MSLFCSGAKKSAPKGVENHRMTTAIQIFIYRHLNKPHYDTYISRKDVIESGSQKSQSGRGGNTRLAGLYHAKYLS